MKKINILFLIICLCIQLSAFAQSITFSEINYKSAPSLDCGDWFEIHNFGTTTVDISNWVVRDSIGINAFSFPINTNIPANGYLVVFRKPSQFISYFSTVTNAMGPFDFKLDNTDSLILTDTGNTVIARAFYNSNRYWPDGADGEGRTLELKNQNTNIGLTDVGAWRDGCMQGSPGKAPVACNDPIIFTEINYNSDSLKSIGEFVELYNNSSNNFDLSNWYLKDAIDSLQNTFKFKPGTILAPGAYLVVSNDTAALQLYKGKKTNFLGNFNFNLNNGGELIRLFNDNNVLKYSFHYRDTIPWTDSADGRGYTLEIKDKMGRTNDGKNYFAGCLGGSPGEAYTPNCNPFFPVAILDDKQDHLLVYPIMATTDITIENAFPKYQQVQIVDASGRILNQQKINSNLITFNINSYTKGFYYIVLQTKQGKRMCKKIIKL